MEEHTNPSTMGGIKSLEEKWGQLRLSEEEENIIVVEHDILEEDSIKE